MRLKPIKHLDDGRAVGRGTVTAAQGETFTEATTRGMRAFLDACPETHYLRRFYAERECDKTSKRPGRETSRRLFLTCVYYPLEKT